MLNPYVYTGDKIARDGRDIWSVPSSIDSLSDELILVKVVDLLEFGEGQFRFTFNTNTGIIYILLEMDF